MTYGQFWDGDSAMAPAFRKAFMRKREYDDWLAWRQGLYFYEALCDVSPIFRALSKAKRPLKYTTEPYGFGEHASETVKEEKENREMKAAKKSMEAFMVAFNKRFEKPTTSEVSADGGRADPRN